MLYCTMAYYDATPALQAVAISNIMECSIGEDSITGYSFWQTEGGTAKLTCPMFPELAAILEQQTTEYYGAEFRIYESTTVQQGVFLGYLKRGNFEYDTEGATDIRQDSIITMTLHNPLKVLIETLTDDMPYPTTWIGAGYACEINYWLPRLLRDLLDRLTYPAGSPFLQTINLVNAYGVGLSNPVSVSGLTLWQESDYPLGDNFYADQWSGDPNVITTMNVRQFEIRRSGSKDYLFYYRNLAQYRDISAPLRYQYYQSIRTHTWEIRGSTLVPIPGWLYNHITVNTYGTGHGSTGWVDNDLTSQHPPLTDPDSTGYFQLTGENRFLRVSGTDTWIATYTGTAAYTHVVFPTLISIPATLRALLRANLASLVCKYNQITIGNKVVDATEFTAVSNEVFAYPKLSSNQYVNDFISAGDLPFTNGEEIANGINNYFREIMKTDLTHEITMDINLNPLTDELTQPLDVGKGYQLGDYLIYITGITIDYENRTAKVKGVGKIA